MKYKKIEKLLEVISCDGRNKINTPAITQALQKLSCVDIDNLYDAFRERIELEKDDRQQHRNVPTSETKFQIIQPIIHLNGTSKSELLEQLCEVHSALGEVYEKMKQASPNGRDYYPVVGLFEKAQEQHRRRLQIVHDLQEELEKQAEELDSQ